MSVEIETGIVAFDDATAQWLKQYRDALIRIKEWQEVADIARSHLESALGDAETGIYQGQSVVRWTSVESSRFDVKKAREILPENVVDLLQTTSTSRRFTLVNQDEV